MPELRQGPGTVRQLPEWLAGRDVVLLTYGRALEDPAIANLIATWPRGGRLRHLTFSTPLLTLEQVSEQTQRLRGGSSPEAWVSIGGGAIQDLAKILRYLGDRDLEPMALLAGGKRERVRSSFHVAVPTTAGTGSEATCFATYYHEHTKYSLEAPDVRPDGVVLDPDLTAGVPRDAAIAAGFDALAQAIESVWSIHATDASMECAEAAIAAIRRSFRPAVLERNPEDLAAMQLAAYRAGEAIQITRTTLAHALSYALSARRGMPHGLAVILNLPRVIRYNARMGPADCQDPQGTAHVARKMARLHGWFGVEDAEGLATAIETLMAEFAVSVDFADHGVTPRELAEWVLPAAAANPRGGNNPRRVELEALRHAYL